MIRLVLDTNVWLDWLVFHDAALQPTRAMVAAGEAQILIDTDCETELVRALGYPLQRWTLDAEQQALRLAESRRIATRVDAATLSAATLSAASLSRQDLTLPACEDPDDQKFLVLAATHAAHWLLTRDHALLKLERHKNPLPFHIVTPAAFAARLRVE